MILQQRTGQSRVTAVPAAEATVAERHFGDRLAFETDPSDVWADRQAGDDGFVLIDVRSRGAFHAGHLPGAISLPVDLIDERAVAGLPAGRTAVTYCWGPGCNGSTRGALRLARLGVPVKEMIGGYEYWVREGLPVERRDGAVAGPLDPLSGLASGPLASGPRRPMAARVAGVAPAGRPGPLGRPLPGSAALVVLALGVTVVLWAGAFVAIRAAVPDFGVAGLVAGRLLVAAVGLAVFAAVIGVRRPARADLPLILGSGVIGETVYQLLLNAGERSVDAGTASVLVNTGPIFTAILAWLILGDRIGPRGRIGLGLGFVGATIIALGQGGGFGPSPDALLIVAAALAMACNILCQKPLLARYTGFELTCYAVWAALIAALPLMPALVGRLPGAGAGAVVALVVLGIGASAIGFITWSYALARADATVTANTLYLVPVVAIAGGWLLLGETPTLVTVLGGLVALAGVAVSRSRPRRAGTVTGAAPTDKEPG